MRNIKRLQIVLMLCLVVVLSLAGCGGGNGGGGFVLTPTTPVTTTGIKGFWTGNQGTAGVSAIILANGDAWVVFLESGNATSFARLQTQTNGASYSSTGTRYLLQTGGTETAAISGSFVEKSQLSVALITASVNNSINLAYDTRYDTTTASAVDAVGSWTGSYGGGTSNLTMNVASTGVLIGSSTTGCSYSGTLQPRSTDPALFDVNFTESCLVGSTKNLSGIATLNAAKTTISFAVTTADKTQGALFTSKK